MENDKWSESERDTLITILGCEKKGFSVWISLTDQIAVTLVWLFPELYQKLTKQKMKTYHQGVVLLDTSLDAMEGIGEYCTKNANCPYPGTFG